MSRRPPGWLAAAVALALAGGLAAFALLRAVTDDDQGPASAEGTTLAAALAGAQPADEPFGGWTAAEVTVGGTEMDVVLADEVAERIQGMRGRPGLGPYDGMLFVYDADTRPSFTMAGVPVSLDLGTYAGDGAPLERLHMVPCEGTDTDCPSYTPSQPFRFALETLEDDLPRGPLAGRPG